MKGAQTSSPRPSPFPLLPSSLRPQYWGFRAALWLTARVPRWLGYRVAELGGELYFWLNPGHSQKAVENYAVMLADDTNSSRVRLMARRSFRNYAKSLFDFFRQASVDPDLYEADAVITGFNYVDDALAQGRGVIVVTPHFGNWDLAGGLVAARGYPFAALADTFSPPEVDELVRGMRARLGLGSIPLSSGTLRRTLAMLRRNQIIAFLSDGPQPEGGVEVSFFGQPALLPGGPARFALRSGAPMLFGYVGRRPGDRTFFGGFTPLAAHTPTGDEAADVRALTQQWVTMLEDLLRQHPDQWYMFRRMWPEAQARPLQQVIS
ncbi:MAG: lysophospholipid acyltransferase family protein [Chloroflexia bacterium]